MGDKSCSIILWKIRHACAVGYSWRAPGFYIRSIPITQHRSIVFPESYGHLLQPADFDDGCAMLLKCEMFGDGHLNRKSNGIALVLYTLIWWSYAYSYELVVWLRCALYVLFVVRLNSTTQMCRSQCDTPVSTSSPVQIGIPALA